MGRDLEESRSAIPEQPKSTWTKLLSNTTDSGNELNSGGMNHLAEQSLPPHTGPLQDLVPHLQEEAPSYPSQAFREGKVG